MVVCGCVWLCVVVCGCVLLCVVVCCCVLLCVCVCNLFCVLLIEHYFLVLAFFLLFFFFSLFFFLLFFLDCTATHTAATATFGRKIKHASQLTLLLLLPPPLPPPLPPFPLAERIGTYSRATTTLGREIQRLDGHQRVTGQEGSRRRLQ